VQADATHRHPPPGRQEQFLRSCKQAARSFSQYRGLDRDYPTAMIREASHGPGPATRTTTHASSSPNGTASTRRPALPPESPERNQFYRQLARMAEVNAVWKLHDTRYRNMLVQPQVIGYKKHPILLAEFMYYDLDNSRRRP
jgi:hypothetical protein